ncbi:MAG: SUMF1/EgtB/PvdO family nonheme iron enzyme [Deltaproteobacteria bacterium]|nr:SUMF1/EgtB/PvdO family nonheme iron enzyme [Deltaproteobacteria bacterium]
MGTYSANGYGLYDMAGNVCERVWDWYDGSWYGKFGATGGDTRGPDSGSLRVLRGSGWGYYAFYLRCSNRDSYVPTDASSYLGFRAALGQP